MDIVIHVLADVQSLRTSKLGILMSRRGNTIRGEMKSVPSRRRTVSYISFETLNTM